MILSHLGSKNILKPNKKKSHFINFDKKQSSQYARILFLPSMSDTFSFTL